MDWKQQFKFHDLSFRNTCIVLLLLVFNLFILTQISFQQTNPEAVSTAYCTQCASQQKAIYGIMCDISGEDDGFKQPSEWTVADLIREAVRKNHQSSHPLPESVFICRNVRKVREHAFPYLRRQRVEVTSPYLVFPVSASVVFDESLQEPVPILMCRPGAHDGKYSSMVLYSDGTTKALTPEEAEKLVAEQSPVPLEIDFEALKEKEAQTP